MGNLIKINIYADRKKEKNLRLSSLENNILKYNNWLKETNREDKIENYEEFLQVR